MRKSHATDNAATPVFTLCGIDISLDDYRPPSGRKHIIDNAMPDCKRCLRAIAARTRDA